MWAKLIFYFEAFIVLFLQVFESWFIALVSLSGLAGAIVAGTLFVLSSGYFFPELREKSKSLFLAAGLFSLVGGSLLFHELGQAIGLFPDGSRGQSQEQTASGSDTSTLPPIEAGTALSAEGLATTTTDGSATESTPLPGAAIQSDTSTFLGTTYIVQAGSDGTWPPLWSDVASSAYTITTVPSGTEVQSTSDCVTDVSGNYWCPIVYEGQSGWIASANLLAK